MIQKIKKTVSILLAILMIVSMFLAVPITANAAIGDVLSENDYLTFTAETANSSVTLNVQSGSDFQYDLNGAGLTDYSPGTPITLENVGDYVRFSGTGTTFNYSNHFSLTGKVACSGNVMSLRLDDDGKVQGLINNCFNSMFEACTGLTSAPELPETELADYCYYRMFYDCINLTKAPALPATTLAQNCYYRMFYGCINLTKAPALPATTLAQNCYNNMFSGCESLTELPALPATTLAERCYRYMFYGCSNICISDEEGTFNGITYSAEYRIPSVGDGTSADDALYGMFGKTGGKFTETPDINTVYYVPSSAPTYTVTWKCGEEVLDTEEYEAGATPLYQGETPTKPEDEDYTYSFAGWTDETATYDPDNLPPVTGDVTYTAQFDATPKPHEHDGITFEKWTSDNSLPTEAGNYYLGYDVTLTSTWTVSKNIRLCLNGNGITKNGGNVITIVGGGNLTIDDCGTKTHYFDVDNGKAVNVNTTPGENRQSFTGGYITGGTGQGYDGYFWSEGGGIYLDGGNLILNGGTILGNSAAFGGGVGIFSGTMTMNGGTVCYNTGNAGISFRTGSNDYNRGRGASTGYFVMNGGLAANNSSGVTTAGYSYGSDYATYNGGKIADNVNTGIYSQNITIAGDIEITGNKYGAGFSNTFSVSGNPVITGNTTSNLSINNGKTINTGTLGENAKIGITMSNPGAFTNGYDANNTIEPTEIFTADDPTTFVAQNAAGEVKLGIYVWTASFNTGGGSGTMDPIEVQKERSFNLPECTFIAPEGKLFLNWSDGTNTYNPGDSCTMTADTEFTAQWIDGIKVSFKANGGSGVMEDVLSYPDYKLPACGFTAPGGKFFNGWLSSADNQVYQPGDTVTLTAETQFKAQWAAEVNYQFDFENGLPDGWQTSNGNWYLNANGGDYNIFPAHSGQKNMTYFARGYNTYGELLTSSFDMTNAESATLGFWYTNRDWGGDTDQLVVSYRVGEGDWVQLFATSGNHESWIKEEITLPSEAFAENVRFRFSVIGNYGYGIALDDVELNLTGSKDIFTGHSLTLSGDIGVNFYLDLTPEQAQKATVNFSWNGNTLENVPVEVDPTGTYAYRVSCPVAAAEMTCPVTATLYVDDNEMGTNVYSVREYADVILSEDYKNDYTGDDYDDLAILVKTMLDYGAKAQLHFGVNTENLANAGIDYDMNPVEADQIPTNKANFGEADFSDYGLEYVGTTVVYLSKTTLRHYFKVTNQNVFEAIKASVTFDEVGAEEPEAAVYGEKGGFIYFAHTNISASNLDTPYALNIGSLSLKFTVLDYSRLVLTSDLSDAEKALAMATYWYNQAANDYFDDAAPVKNIVDLSALTDDYVAQDGDVLTGTLSGDYQITIADGATVTLKNATISSLTGEFAGITPLGDATILLVGTNTVKGGHEDYPGIYAAPNATLTIDGKGSLDASSNGCGCGIGGGLYMPSGNIVINGGTITANGGRSSAGIGSGAFASCGTITINGGTVTAIGGEDAAGIGSGYDATCGNITINGGTVTAIGGKDAPGIGGGVEASCGNITITYTVTMVTATKGGDESDSIGAAKFCTCGDVTIGDAVVDPITESPYTYEPSQA